MVNISFQLQKIEHHLGDRLPSRSMRGTWIKLTEMEDACWIWAAPSHPFWTEWKKGHLAKLRHGLLSASWQQMQRDQLLQAPATRTSLLWWRICEWWAQISTAVFEVIFVECFDRETGNNTDPGVAWLRISLSMHHFSLAVLSDFLCFCI